MVTQDFRVDATWVLPLTAIVLATAIFIADTITELEIACPVFYTAVVLIAARFCKKRGIVFVGVACIALTLLSDLLTIDGAPSQAGAINTCISLAAIAATTYLAVKIEREKEAAFEARTQLAHVARVTTLGGMTANIAHEVNQPLTAVLINGNACLHWLDAEPPDLKEARKNITNIVRDANRASEIVVQVRDLTKGLPPASDWLSVNEIIVATIALIDREVRQNQISIQTQLSDDLPPINGDRVQIQQVLLNLLLNSIEAMRSVAIGSRRLLLVSAKSDSNSVLISVHDTGKGFSSSDLYCLFDPFYTSKTDGMGIGLTISRSIVESHGGRIWATPNSPRGAVFHFTLPIDVRVDRPVNKDGFRWENSSHKIGEGRAIGDVHLNSRLNVS